MCSVWLWIASARECTFVCIMQMCVCMCVRTCMWNWLLVSSCLESSLLTSQLIEEPIVLAADPLCVWLHIRINVRTRVLMCVVEACAPLCTCVHLQYIIMHMYTYIYTVCIFGFVCTRIGRGFVGTWIYVRATYIRTRRSVSTFMSSRRAM